MRPILVDSSVWIDFFRNRETAATAAFEAATLADREIVTADLIMMEVLQGFRLRGRLRSQRGSGEPGHKGARSAVQEGATLPGGTPCGQRRAGPMSATSAPGRP